MRTQKKRKLLTDNSLRFIQVIPERFERSTHALEGRCSIQLSYGTILICGAKVVLLFKYAKALCHFFTLEDINRLFLSEALLFHQFGHNYHSQHSQSKTPLNNNRLQYLFLSILSFTSSTTFTPHCDSIFYPLHYRTIIF